MRGKLAIALALLLICGTAAAAWNQTVEVLAKDKNGLPAADCDVRITYQKAGQNLSDDGTASGVTNAQGSFSTKLSNVVPDGNDSKRIKVAVSSYYWEGETQTAEADASDRKQVDFTVPFELEKLQVTALSFSGATLPGATVTIYGTAVKSTAGAGGVAVLYLPRGLQFAGFVNYGRDSQSFTSEQLKAAGDGKSIEVKMPQSKPQANATKKAITFSFTLTDSNGMPVANQAVDAAYPKGKASVSTDGQGFAQFDMAEPGTVSLSIKKNDYDYPFTFSVKESRTEIVALPPLLKVGSFSQMPQGRNCYRLSANVSDPRTSLPLTVKFSKAAKNITTVVETGVDDAGLFFANLCVDADTSVKVMASNKYDAVESAPMQLVFQGNAPQQQQNAPAPAEKPNYDPIRGKTDYTLWAVVLIMLAVAGAGAYLARKQLSPLLKFVVEYLRMVYLALTNRRRKPPMPGMPEAPPVA